MQKRYTVQCFDFDKIECDAVPIKRLSVSAESAVDSLRRVFERRNGSSISVISNGDQASMYRVDSKIRWVAEREFTNNMEHAVS